MHVQLAQTSAQLKFICPVLLQLRPQYSAAELIEQIELQKKDGYQIAYVVDNQKVLSVAGFVIGQKLAWQKHIYVDDLITDEAQRSTGAGKFLIDWLKQYGREQDCQQLHLDSGVTRFPAHKFYLREGFDIRSHHFAVVDLNAD